MRTKEVLTHTGERIHVPVRLMDAEVGDAAIVLDAGPRIFAPTFHRRVVRLGAVPKGTVGEYDGVDGIWVSYHEPPSGWAGSLKPGSLFKPLLFDTDGRSLSPMNPDAVLLDADGASAAFDSLHRWILGERPAEHVAAGDEVYSRFHAWADEVRRDGDAAVVEAMAGFVARVERAVGRSERCHG